MLPEGDEADFMRWRDRCEKAEARVRELASVAEEAQANADQMLGLAKHRADERDEATAKARELEADVARAPGLRDEANGEAGDFTTLCDACHQETDEPHSAKDCVAYRDRVSDEDGRLVKEHYEGRRREIEKERDYWLGVRDDRIRELETLVADSRGALDHVAGWLDREAAEHRRQFRIDVAWHGDIADSLESAAKRVRAALASAEPAAAGAPTRTAELRLKLGKARGLLYEYRAEGVITDPGQLEELGRILAETADPFPPPDEDADWTKPPAGQAGDVRPVVRWFAEQMEAALRKNDHKGGWETCRIDWLIHRIGEELQELSTEATSVVDIADVGRKRRVLAEAADVANMAMMVADHFRDGGPSKDSGRAEPPQLMQLGSPPCEGCGAAPGVLCDPSCPAVDPVMGRDNRERVAPAAEQCPVRGDGPCVAQTTLVPVGCCCWCGRYMGEAMAEQGAGENKEKP